MSKAPTISISGFKNIIVTLAKIREKRGDLRITPILWGEKGCGKTECIEQAAAMLGYNFVICRIADWRLEDMIGTPVVVRNPDGSHKNVYSRPPWMDAVLSDPRPAILGLDEYNRARDLEVYQVAMSLLLEGRVGEHRLRPCDLVVATANPDTAAYQVQPVGDVAQISRFAHYVLEPDRNEWLSYARETGVHRAAIAAFEENPNICPRTVIDVEHRPEIESDPRGISRFGRVLQVMEETQTYERKTAGLIGFGMIGIDATNQILFKKEALDAEEAEKKLLTVDSIMAGRALEVVRVKVEVEKVVSLNASLADWLAVNGAPAEADNKKNIVEWYLAQNLEQLCSGIQALKSSLRVRGNDTDAVNLKTVNILDAMSEEIIDRATTAVSAGKAPASTQSDAAPDAVPAAVVTAAPTTAPTTAKVTAKKKGK